MKDWTGKDWKAKNNNIFSKELQEEFYETMGETLQSFWKKRQKEINKSAYMRITSLNSVDFAVLLEFIYKLKGKKYHRYYKSGYKPEFVDMMQHAIEEEEEK